MSRPSFAALPADRSAVPEEFKAQPAERRLMGCPFCRKADQIVLDLPYVQHNYALVYDAGVTTPVIEVGDDAGMTTMTEPDPNGIRCLNCNWQYRGPSPLSRMVIL